MSDVNVTKRVEPSIHSSTLDGFRIVNQHPPKSPEEAEAQKAERVPPPRSDGQPIRTQARTVTIKGAPLEVQMGGSGAVVVRRPPPPIGSIGGAPAMTGPIGQPRAAAIQPATLTADQAELCSILVRQHLEQAIEGRASEGDRILAKSTLAALAKIAPHA